MDRVISLLAALVGLIALGGAILVHVNADAERRDLAAQIAEIRTSLRSGAALPAEASVAELASAPSIEAAASSTSSSASMVAAGELSQAASDQAAEISSLEAQVAELERENASQASALATAQTGSVAPASVSPSSSSSVSGVAIIGADALAPSSLTPGSEVSSAPAASSAAAAGNEDCIPLGTRFVGKAGDKFAICRSKLVVKILGVSDGQAVVEGAGPIAAGGFGNLSGAAGCTVMVFTADVTGYADLRVTCQ